MAIQDFFNDVKTRVDNVQKPYREAFKAYVQAQRKVLDVVSSSAQNLAKTEGNAARDVFAAARASFDKARKDGVRQVASQPQAYVPEGRDRLMDAYKATIELLRKTGNDLGDVVTKGYKDVVNKLTGKPGSKRKSATTRKATGTKKTNGTNASARKASTAKSGARKTATKRSTGTSKTATGGTASGATSS